MAKSKWTVMVYMGADNLASERNLSKAARADLVEMRNVGSDENLTILAQVDDSTVGFPRRYEVLKDELVPQKFSGDSAPIDMASARVLTDFLEWGFSHDAERYLLILWGHAYRFAFGFDASGDGDGLDYQRLSTVLARFRKARNRNLDILGFDACGVSSIEVAYQFRESVDYLVASEVVVPLLGWPYERILGAIRRSPAIESDALSRLIVDEYLRSMKDQSVMLAALNLARHDVLLKAMNNLAASLAVAVADPRERNVIATSFDLALFASRDPLVDLAKLCDGLRLFTSDTDLAVASKAVLDLLGSDDFVIALDRRGKAVQGLGGVSAYAPHVAPESVRRTIDKRYQELDLAQATLWPAVVGFLNIAT